MSAVIAHEPAPEDRRAVTMNPAQLVALAVEKGANIDQLERLMGLQERWQANEAKIHFVAALNAFKANPPALSKNKHVKFTTSKGVTEYHHATLDHVSDSIGKALAEHNLSHRWEVEQQEGGQIRVTCCLTHIMGHTEKVSLAAARDDSGSKNSIQAIGSTVTYLQRYTLLASTGMAVGGADNDGAGDDTGRMPDEQFEAFVSKIQKATNKDDAKAAWREGLKVCEALGDRDTAEALKGEMLAHCKFIDGANR